MRHHRNRPASIGLTVGAAVLGGLSWAAVGAAPANAAPPTKCGATSTTSSYAVSCPRGTSGLYRAYVRCSVTGPGGTTIGLPAPFGPTEYVNAPNTSRATCPDGWTKMSQDTEWVS